MIYTQYGVPVEIVAANLITGQVVVRDAEEPDNPDGHRFRNLSELKADGGWGEIIQAAKDAPGC